GCFSFLAFTDNQNTSKILQAVRQPVVKSPSCPGSRELCVGGTNGKDSCNGDSGGPLLWRGTFDSTNMVGQRYYLLGIVSRGSGVCGDNSMPAIYTRVSYYMKWILDHMEEASLPY
ncbi:hypothetical protein WDU94_000066, partial [Cyamophila willieti]